MPRISAPELSDIVRSIVEAVGSGRDNAEIVARVLVGSHLAGHDSHGIQHIPRYVREVEAGEILAAQSPQIISETKSSVSVRGNWTWGHVTADFVTRQAIERAQENGMAVVSAVECHHIGRLGEYVEVAAAENLIALLFLGGQGVDLPAAAPHGGAKPVLAPNAIGLGFPTAEGHPIVVDFACTRTSGGKIALAKARGESFPLGYLIDENGNPTTDLDAFLGNGALLPFGEHKGFGIMIAAEILGRILAGSDGYSESVHGGGPGSRHAGITMIAIDSDLFGSSGSFGTRANGLGDLIRSVPPAPGVSQVLMPGDFEGTARTERLQDGFEIPEGTWSELLDIATRLGVEVEHPEKE